MRVEHLMGWLTEARKGEEAVEKSAEAEGKGVVIGETGGEDMDTKRETMTEVMTQWEKVVAQVSMAFGEGRLAEESIWQAVILIPKGKCYYCGIGLMEVVWKVVVAILNLRLTASITYHDFLHEFQAGRGTGTATLEAKLLQQLAALREEVLYVIFLDLHKAYDALDRSRCLEILEGYGVGP